MTLRVMTFNIRVLTSNDGPNQWRYRREAVAGMLNGRDLDLIGFQEATRSQIDDLAGRLAEHDWVGTGRLGGQEGEYCPIFYRRRRLELLEHGDFWLSNTPDKPTMGWDAAYIRITTWAKFRDVTNGREWFFLNTHLDNKGEQARCEGAKLIGRRIGELAGQLPVIMLGDFNCGCDSPAYTVLTGETCRLRDARLCARQGHRGPIETFTGFHGSNITPCLIDYILVGPAVGVLRTETLADDWEGRQLSDHRALLAEVAG